MKETTTSLRTLKTKQKNEAVLDTSAIFVFNHRRTFWQRLMKLLREILR